MHHRIMLSYECHEFSLHCTRQLYGKRWGPQIKIGSHRYDTLRSRVIKRYDLFVTKSAPNAIESNARRGRPRNDDIRQLILNTALDLAFEVGFRALTVEAIAAKAGVGKTTIYRRWPNKGAVVMDAFLSIVGPKTIFPSTDRAINSIQLQMKAQVKAFRSRSCPSGGPPLRSVRANASRSLAAR